MRVAKTSARAGHSIPATLIIHNKTGRRVRVVGCEVDATFEIGLEDARLYNFGPDGDVGCHTTLNRGRNVFHRQISTYYAACGDKNEPKCNLRARIPAPPLPAGTYHTIVGWPGGTHIPRAGRVTITITH